MPEFEGASGYEGLLGSQGFLQTDEVNTAGLLVLSAEGREHPIDGLFDSSWTFGPPLDSASWSNLHTESVFHQFCRAYNDKSNAYAAKYSFKP